MRGARGSTVDKERIFRSINRSMIHMPGKPRNHRCSSLVRPLCLGSDSFACGFVLYLALFSRFLALLAVCHAENVSLVSGDSPKCRRTQENSHEEDCGISLHDARVVDGQPPQGDLI